ncbi:MAG: GTP 3',8-cyclase MoaA [Halanaerobiales bacterium]|nr:GTP 3',8-cyclase MoaA [Halanaerobiales bacterium]MCF8009423.1 GTP 3',8-cyclase MoaA [Halanaerobiales bacterium]
MNVNYLRISITDRCNLRCFYCMPEEGLDLKEHSEIMSYEEIYQVTKIASKLGITKVRITGGEPLARLNSEELIGMINSIDEIEEITMTTNGVSFAEKAEILKENGLSRINISLDTLDRKQYKQITGKDKLDKVMESIKKAKELDLSPVKVNTVLIKGYNDDQLDDFIKFMDEEDIVLRFIEYMPIGNGKNNDNHISLKEIKNRLEEKHTLTPVDVKGNGPAHYFKISGYKGKLGFISPFTHNICDNCNRLRLTSDGKLRSCLLKEDETSLYSDNELLSEEKIKKIFLKSIKSKSPHDGYDKILKNNKKSMHSIGG